MKKNLHLHLLSRGAVFFAASSSLSLPSVVSAAEAAVVAAASSDDLQSTRNSYASNRALMSDEQRSDVPDVASIINGTATDGPLSYQVGLAREVGFAVPRVCGGSLIASRVVLTAAHCVVDDNGSPIDPPLNKVLINAYDLSSFNGWAYGPNSVVIEASSYAVHPEYNFLGGNENDIALWFLPIPIGEDDNFKFATLNEDDNVPAVDEELFVSGWGLTVGGDPDSQPILLQGTNVDYITNEQCKTDYDTLDIPPITDGMLCTAGDGTGPCSGDSGGPLMIANGDGPAMDPPIQVGIVSWAVDNCNPPGGYTRVSHYVDWIRSTACEEVGEFCPSSSKSSKSKSSKSDRP